MLSTVILFIVLGLVAYQVNKRIERIEDIRRNDSSFWFSINVVDAFSRNTQYRTLRGIKNATKDYNKWTEEEKKRWGKHDKSINEMKVNIAYLSAENAYYVSTPTGFSNIIFRKELQTNPIYSTVVAGDKELVKPYIRFIIYERLIHNKKGLREWCITPSIDYHGGGLLIKDNSDNFEALCDFPIFPFKTDEELKKLGFGINNWGGDDVFEDDFGDKHVVSTEKTFKKNGANITFYLD